MTLSCNCDMPDEIYWDWLQDQGWDTDELREAEGCVGEWASYEGEEGSSYAVITTGNGDKWSETRQTSPSTGSEYPSGSGNGRGVGESIGSVTDYGIN